MSRRTPSNPLPRMHIKAGRYYHVAYIDKRRVWTPLGGTYADAVVKWAELESTQPRKGESFDDMAREFTLAVLPTVRDKTRAEWARLIKTLGKTFTGVMLADIQPHHVSGHIRKRRIEGAPVSGNREASLLQQMFRHAIAWGWISANPCVDAIKNKESARDRYLTDAEFAAIRLAAPPIIRAAMDIAYATGMRVGDLLALKVSDIDGDTLFVRQGKTGIKCKYLITPDLARAIASARTVKRQVGTLYILGKRNGQEYSYYGFRSMFARAAQRAGVDDVHFHDIRGKAITDAVAEGRDAQSFSQHRDRAQADAYVKAREIPVVLPLELSRFDRGIVEKG